MFGNGTDIGLLRRSVQFILETKPALYISCVELIQNSLHDLTDGQKKIDNVENRKKVLIETLFSFNDMLSKVLALQTQKETDQNLTSSRSHLFIFVEDKSGTVFTCVDLAGWEDPKTKTDSQLVETKFINASLSGLNTALEKIATNNLPSFDSALTKAFKPVLKGPTKICMLYHVSNAGVIVGLKNIKNIVASNKATESKRRSPLENIKNTMRLS